ncbi:MAG: hypothetical protein IV090_02380 [Candidatus Sericytochromatia bacterium]|nr:hypothetical protein [Candidatus Sericytochromatia bacterium]
MGNITNNYSELTQLHRSGALFQPVKNLQALPEDNLKALNEAKAATQKVLSSGVAGSDAQDALGTVAKIEQISRLSKGDVNAANLKAAVDLGEQLTRGQVQQVLGNVSAPLGAVVSVQSFGSNLDKSLDNPNPENLKGLINSTKGATTSVGTLSKLLAEHVGQAGTVLTRGSQALSHVGSVLNIGVAAMDVAIAGKDIHNFWVDPNLKSFTKMGLGLVAASASVIVAAKVPGLGTQAVVVAALADAGKMGVDVNWKAVYNGVSTTVTTTAQSQMQQYKREVLESRLPAGGDPTYRRMVVLSPLN